MASPEEGDADIMEVEKVANNSSDNDALQEEEASSDSTDSEEQQESFIADLEKKVAQNPYEYSVHVDLIKILRKVGELDKLRAARENMAKHFPLSADLWLAWLEDEVKLAESEEEKTAVTQLFERAVKDYLSVDLWLEYAQFCIGCMGQKDGIDSVRSVFERSLTAAGLHVARGIVLWEAYREFEDVVMTMLEQKADTSVEDENKFLAQRKRMGSLFRRQLNVPLMNMENTFAEYTEWVASAKGEGPEEGPKEVDKNVELNYKKALAKLSKVLPFERELLSSENKQAVYQSYLEHERINGDPARVQCLYERALADLCLDPTLWLEYIHYLDTQLKIDTVVTPACERAVRNCPWSSQLWQYYLRVLERYHALHDRVKDVMEQALGIGFPTAEDYRNLWLAYLDYLRRSVKWDKEGEREEGARELRITYNRACEHLAQYFGLNGDPTCAVLQSWARMEAIHGHDMEEARRLWNDIMSQGHDRLASMWLEYIALEKCYGDTKHLRRVYQRALNSVQDWPECVGDAWLNFERDEGTLESLENCEAKYKARLKYIQEQREKQAQKEVEAMEREERRRQMDPRTQGGGGKRKDRDAAKRNLEDAVGKWAAVGAQSVVVKALRRNAQLVEQKAENKTEQKVEVPPPPGYREQGFSWGEPPAKRTKKAETFTDHGVSVPHDSSKDNRTVFVSNLDYTTEESAVRKHFAAIGTITDLRLVKDYKGRSKGYCYMEFSSVIEAAEALTKDRELLNNRPVYVSKCDPDRHTRQPGFKYSTELEKSKLFVRGLPLTTTKQQLEDLFCQFGKLKDVRVVTYRNGHSKGLAYVEFIDEAAAAHALIKTDGMTLEDRVISVAISKPPERKGGPSALPNPVPSLGGGSKELGVRGRGRTQMFVPSSIQRMKQPAGVTVTHHNIDGANTKENGNNKPIGGGGTDVSESTKVMTNADFRAMLMGNK